MLKALLNEKFSLSFYNREKLRFPITQSFFVKLFEWFFKEKK
jgi:hypothetical protein